MGIEILGKIFDSETIAQGRGIRELDRLRKVYGPGRWKKRKGIARVRLSGSLVVTAEVHWDEAHGVGRKEFKLKRIVGDRS